MQIRPTQIMVVGMVALQTAEDREWAVSRPHAPLDGKLAPLLADKARSAAAINTNTPFR
jgi:hypothetical protein